MMFTDDPERVCAFLTDRCGAAETPDSCVTFGWVTTEGELRAALAFHHWNGVNLWCDLAIDGGYFPRELLFAGLWYCFGQLGAKRLTLHVAASNLQSLNLVEKLGAYREATLQDGCLDGDAYIYCIRPDRCRIWSKLNGKIGLSPSST